MITAVVIALGIASACSSEPTPMQPVATTTPTTFDATKRTYPAPARTTQPPVVTTTGDEVPGETLDSDDSAVTTQTPATPTTTGDEVPGETLDSDDSAVTTQPPAAPTTTGDEVPGETLDSDDSAVTTQPPAAPTTTGDEVPGETLDSDDSAVTTQPPAAPTTTGDEVPGETLDSDDSAVTTQPPAAPTTAGGEEQVGSERVAQPNPPPTEDLYAGLSYDAPNEAVRVFGDETVLVVMPDTANDVLGWTWDSWAWEEAYDGYVKLVFDGWLVEHRRTEGEPTARVTLFFTMVGDYTIKNPLLGSLTLLPASDQGTVDAVTAVRWEGSGIPTGPVGEGVPVDVEWLDPGIWATVNPGEQRPVWMRWTVPIDTDRLEVTINKTTYVVLPQDPGAWGDITDRPTRPVYPVSSSTDLQPLCLWEELCERFGSRLDRALLFFDGVPTGSGWVLSLRIEPAFDVSGMSSTNVQVWHEGDGALRHPMSDPWAIWEETGGQMDVVAIMPTRDVPLNTKIVFPDGGSLVWRTVRPMRDTLFSNPDWVWETPNRAGGELAALETADLVCWAHWTGRISPGKALEWASPHRLRPGLLFDVTEEMIGWLTAKVCDHAG